MASARAYHRPLYAAAISQTAVELLLLGLAAFSRLGAWLYAPLSGWAWWAALLAFGALLEAARTALALPYAFWAGFLREHRFGFSTQSLPAYAADRAKGFALSLLLTDAALAGLVASARFLPVYWPIPLAAGGALALAALAFAAPLLVEPLFNRFVPLADSELAAELEALAVRAGVPLEGVLVADASRRTRKANAYVSGLGRTRRLVVYDTLLERSGRAEVGLVLAHELGHRRAGHLLKGTLGACVGLAALVACLWALLRLGGLEAAIGAPRGGADPRIAAFALLLASALALLAAPLGAALSRRFEREADRFSLELTGDPATFEATQRALAAANLSDLDPPRPVYLAFFSHPTPVERIGAARALSASGSGTSGRGARHPPSRSAGS